MINLKFILGLFPKTTEIETNEAALVNEYNELQKYTLSDELKHFLELQKTIESEQFKAKEQEIKALDYKKTNNFVKEQNYLQLQKSSGIKNYYKVLSSELYKNYLKIEGSIELEKYFELQKLVLSDTFKKNKEQLKANKYKGSEKQAKEVEYNKMLNSKSIINYYKVLESDNLKLYNTLNNGDRIKQFEELKKYVESETIVALEKKIKTAKFNETAAYKKFNELQNILKSSNYKKYKKLIASASYRVYMQLNNSDTIKNYLKLQTTIQSGTFIKAKTEAGKKFKETENYKLEKEYLKLKHDNNIQAYFKFEAAKYNIVVADFEKSGMPEKIKNLENYIVSDEYKKEQNYYQQNAQARWQQHAEYTKVKKYLNEKADAQIISYYKFKSSKEFELYNKTIKAGEVQKFEALKKIVTSPEFIKEKEYMLLPFETKWQQTPESKTETTYNELKVKPEFINYFKFIASAEFKLFNTEVSNGNVAKYEELEKFVNTNEFKTNKSYLLLKPEAKWQQTNEYQLLQEYNTLKNTEKVKWYFKVYQSNKFDDLKNWKLTFEENFDKPQIDREKWLTRYYYGDKLLNDTYSLFDDKHYISEGKNLKINNSILSIETRSEKAEGKAWHPLMGFIPRQFEFTTGHINTGKSFRQQYGKFKAKIKMSDNGAVSHSFWLVSDGIMPQIDIIKFNNGKWYWGNFWGNITEKQGINKNINSLVASKLCSNYFIYEIEWSEKCIIWKINNLIIKTQTQGIPSEPMYIAFSSGIYKQNNALYPVEFNVDWVRCYSKSV